MCGCGGRRSAEHCCGINGVCDNPGLMDITCPCVTVGEYGPMGGGQVKAAERGYCARVYVGKVRELIARVREQRSWVEQVRDPRKW
jgi:hypothetical protein